MTNPPDNQGELIELKRVVHGRYIEVLMKSSDGHYFIMHGEKDFMYGPNGACWHTSHNDIKTLGEAEKIFREITK